MTAVEVRQLSRAQRDELWASLRADRLPVGTYDGRTWPVSVRPVWRGKVFTKRAGYSHLGRVVNRIGPWLLVNGGTLCTLDEVVRIDYPFGLTDYLKPVNDTLWLGYLRLGPFGKIWVTLEKQGEG